MKQLNELQVKWLEALESGEYLQAKNALQSSIIINSSYPSGYESSDVGFCCLGVACKVHPDVSWKIGYPYINDAYVSGDQTGERNQSDYLSQFMLSQIDISVNEQQELANMNDEMHTFNKIAARIREMYRAKGYEA